MDRQGITIRITMRTLVIVGCFLIGGALLWLTFGSRLRNAPPAGEPPALAALVPTAPASSPLPTRTAEPTVTAAPTRTAEPPTPTDLPIPTDLPTSIPTTAATPTTPPTPTRAALPTPIPATPPTPTPPSFTPPTPPPFDAVLPPATQTAIMVQVQATMAARPKIQYVVDGSAKEALITYTLHDNISQTTAILPWKSPIFTVLDNDFFSVSAQNQGTNSEVTCHILVDGKEVSTDTAFVDYGIAQCEAPAPE